MLMRRMRTVLLCVLLSVAEGVAEISPTGVVLTGDALDRHSVAVGMQVEIVYGTGPRHGFSGKWAKVVTIRGTIELVDWERGLIVIQTGVGRTKTIPLDRI